MHISTYHTIKTPNHFPPSAWGQWSTTNQKKTDIRTALQQRLCARHINQTHRCWNLWNTSTKALCVSGTVFFKHKYITNPSVTPEDAVISAANRMTDAPKIHHPHNICEDDIQALHFLEQIFEQAADNNKELGFDRWQASLSNKSSVWLDYIELRTQLNQFGMFG